uniref:Uncharacterized protein n=1 Tax=Anguilla anguilla TaxID=7936 RepID=A0A0E9SG96_ANGAN
MIEHQSKIENKSWEHCPRNSCKVAEI